MKLYFHIDESGGFEEGLKALTGREPSDPSVVGGLCSALDADGWGALLREAVRRFNETRGTAFVFPGSLHCSRVLAGKVPGAEDIGGGMRRDFVQEIFAVVQRNARFLFMARNDPPRFEYSRQATYGANLSAALRAALPQVAGDAPRELELEIVIASRSIGETRISDTDPTAYNQDLVRFLRAQVAVGEGSGAQLAQRLEGAGRLGLQVRQAHLDAGLMAADFVCLARSEADLRAHFAVICTPDEVPFGDLPRFFELETERLQRLQLFAAAFGVARRCLPSAPSAARRAAILEALCAEGDPAVLQRELQALLAEMRLLIERRTQEEDALATARATLGYLVAHARSTLKKALAAARQRVWADFHIRALVELGTCYDHAGMVGPQEALERELREAMTGSAHVLSATYRERSEILLEAQTHHLNTFFNSYRFEDVLSLIEPEANRRQAEIPLGVPDELLGKMLGSLGQACAFLARTDANWAPLADGYLEQSGAQFSPGTIYAAMNCNYRATLAIQQGDALAACGHMSRHPQLPKVESPAELAAGFQHLITHPHASTFDAVNFARLAALCLENGSSFSVGAIDAAAHHWAPRTQVAHPHQQLCKWIALLYYLLGEYSKASEWGTRGIDLCQQLGFTVRTIGLSIFGLQALSLTRLGDKHGSENCRHRLRSSAQKLGEEAPAFATYLSHFGGPAGLVRLLEGDERAAALAICRFCRLGYQ